VLEARHVGARGLAHVDWYAHAGLSVVIQIGRAAPLDATIAGRVLDATGAPVGDAVVRAAPSMMSIVAATVYATTAADGAFVLAGVDHAAYDVSTELPDHLPAVRRGVLGGSRGVDLVVEPGLAIAGRVVDAGGAPVPAFTVVARGRTGVAHAIAATAPVLDPQGQFAIRVRPGDYDLVAVGRGCARSAPVPAAAGARELRLVIGGTATVRGRVTAADDDTPVAGATVTCDLPGLDHDVPGDPGVRTAADGSFALTEIPAGPLEILVRADGFDAVLDSSLTAQGGAALGPLAIALTRTEPGRRAGVEQVGIGVRLLPDRDALRVARVEPGGGAFDAGVEIGDEIVAVEGVPVEALGLDGAILRLRGAAGTLVTLTLRRGGVEQRVSVARHRQVG
jgi:hypothetical protein